MNSKEALNYIKTCKISAGVNYDGEIELDNLYNVLPEKINIIEKDLDRLEELEKENQELKERIRL